MKKQENKDKTIFIATYSIMFILLIMCLIIWFMTMYFIPKESTQVIIILGTTALLVISAICAIIIESKVGYFICEKCNHKFQTTPTKITLAPHIWTTRYLKCPECGKKSWCKKVNK